jgi:hypothetical protein
MLLDRMLLTTVTYCTLYNFKPRIMRFGQLSMPIQCIFEAITRDPIAWCDRPYASNTCPVITWVRLTSTIAVNLRGQLGLGISMPSQFECLGADHWCNRARPVPCATSSWRFVLTRREMAIGTSKQAPKPIWITLAKSRGSTKDNHNTWDYITTKSIFRYQGS